LSEQPPAWGPDDGPPLDDGEPPRSAWLLPAIPVCLLLGIIELNRAIDGHARAWAYAVEWPMFAGLFYYVYRKLKRNEPIFKPYRPEDYPEDEPKL
jgi:hypothetical protein